MVFLGTADNFINYLEKHGYKYKMSKNAMLNIFNSIPNKSNINLKNIIQIYKSHNYIQQKRDDIDNNSP